MNNEENDHVVPVPQYCAETIKKIRETAGMTQKMFAAYLNVSVRTVEAWEAGRNHPSGAAARLLQMMEMDKGLVIKFPFIKTGLPDGMGNGSGRDGSPAWRESLREKLGQRDFDKMLPIIDRLEKGDVSPAELGEITGKSASTVRRCMEVLVKTGLVRKVGSTSRLVYKVEDMKRGKTLPVHRKTEGRTSGQRQSQVLLQ